ncbi:MAG: hypothetical protein RXO54_08120 [Acidilobus sp.]|jgi:cobalamin synthase
MSGSAGERRSVGGLVRKLLSVVSWPVILSGSVAIVLSILAVIYNNLFMSYLAGWFFWVASGFIYAKIINNKFRDEIKKEAEEVRHSDILTKYAWAVFGVGGVLAIFGLPIIFALLFYFMFFYCTFSCYMNAFTGIENDIAGLLIVISIVIIAAMIHYVERKVAPDPESIGI